MSAEGKFIYAILGFWLVCIVSALSYLSSYFWILAYLPFIIAPILVLRFKHDSVINSKHWNPIPSFVLFIIWISSVFLRIAMLINQDWEYPLEITFIAELAFYSGWISSAKLIQRSSPKKLFFFFLISVEFLVNVAYLQRSLVLLWFLALWLSRKSSVNIKRDIKYGFLFILALISLVYARTWLSEASLNWDSQELKEVVLKSVERPSFYLRTDEKVLKSDTTFETEFPLTLAFKPRFIFPEKPDLKPGLEIYNLFWSNDSAISKQAHFPIGFIGSHVFHFQSLAWLSVLFHVVLLGLIVFFASYWARSVGWIAYFFVFTQFLIPEHFVFYLTSWIRISPIFLGFYGLTAWYQLRGERIPVLVYSDSVEFGGIQRIVSEIQHYFDQNSISFKTLILKKGIFGKLIFGVNYFWLLTKNPLFVSTHLHFNRLFRFRFSGTKVITLLHGIETLSKRANKLTRFSDVVFSNSRQTCNSIPLHPNRIIVRYPFLDTSTISIKKSEYPLFIIVGRLSNIDLYKDYDAVLSAFVDCKSKLNNAELWVIGTGERKNHLKEKYPPSSGIHFLGFIDDVELIKAYQRAWAFILLSTKEGQGLTYFESMLAGTPVIGLKKSVLSEFIQHEKQGILLNSPTELHDYLIKLSNNKSFRESISQNARDYASRIHQENLFFTNLMQEITDVRNPRTFKI